VAEIVRGGQTGSLDHIDSSQNTFRTQIAALTDAVRQLSGAAEIAAGATVNDPLSAPYVLYVNPFTGKDTFVSGSYSTSGTATERIELQRLECGYTEARPFKTVNRAVIEAGIITAKSYYTSPLTNNDLVSIILMPGVSTVLNGTGATSVSEWSDDKDPTNAELTEFNPNSTGGLILPRGVSLCGIDLRKTIFKPAVVPGVADEASDYSNRRAIFKVTGTGYYFGFTFMDKAGSTASHHLLDCFQFASETELDEFYGKIRQAFGGTNNTGNLDNDLAVTNASEYQITGPQPAAGSQTVATDTTNSASPYIFNTSIRSNYGLCGIFADGSVPEGFRSIVVAQFTGVSLQRDTSCWEKYSAGSWGAFADYDDYIATSPNDTRMDPNRRSFHIRAVNEAVIQEVSVFAIGQGVHHWTESGGEITITNSNSNFGGCAAISDGYRTSSFAADSDWNVSTIKVADNLSGLSNNVRRIYLGTVSAITSSRIDLTTALGESATVSGVPDIVAKDGYTLREDSYLWVENPLGKDWRTTFTASAWSTSDTDRLNISAAIEDEDGETPGTTAAGNSNAIGKRVYIRRFVDTRTPEQRRYTLKLANTSSAARLPVRDYVIQTDTSDSVIDAEFGATEVLLVQGVAKTSISGASLGSEIILRRGNTSQAWAANTHYKKGETVTRSNKHFTCIEENEDATFTATKWSESYVHMASTFNPEDYYKNESPILIFDDDTAGTESSTTLGYNFSTLWGSNTLIRDQYRAATDYRALHLFLTAIGFTSAQAHTLLTPQASASRELDPSDSGDMDSFIPSGAANALDNWAVQFRRPSVIRLFGHAWEWAGYLNYTKAIPKYQGQLSDQNKFTYYFTNVDGGRVYATGFNEEGYQVTPRGLEDISTGETLSVENLGANDITLDTPTEFTNLTLNGTTTINDSLTVNATNVTLSSAFDATTTNSGVGTIASIDDIDNSSTATTDSQLNSAGPAFVTPGGLKYWADSTNVVTVPAVDAEITIVHVVPSGVTALTGADSVPYGYPSGANDGTRYSASDYPNGAPETITEAMVLASRLFVPTGSSILISVHGDIGSVEEGPLQLANSYASVIVAGARGATTAPIIEIEDGTTALATDRMPEYSGNVYSAGVVFADVHLKIDANNVNSVYATLNGGFAVGGKNTTLEWSRINNVAAACTNSYGEKQIFRSYNQNNADLEFRIIVQSAQDANSIISYYGQVGGLLGHGAEIVFDVRQADTGESGQEQLTLAFENNSAYTIKLNWLACGGRGGCRAGGRVAPVIDLDFNADAWDLSGWCHSNFTSSQNFYGRSFQIREVATASAAGVQAQYNMSVDTYNSLVDNPIQLSNGCTIDPESNGLKGGPFSLYKRVENALTLADPNLLLTADTTARAFIHRDNTAGKNQT